MRRIFRDTPLQIFLVPIVFILSHFFTIVLPQELEFKLWDVCANFLLAFLVCSIPPFLVFKTLTRKTSAIKGAILASMISVVLFFSSQWLESATSLFVNLRMRYSLPLVALILLSSLLWVIKTKRTLKTFDSWINTTLIALILYHIILVGLELKSNKTKSSQFVPETLSLVIDSKPNVYFILLDSYTSNKSLREFFSFDNSEFTKRLNELNFEVSDHIETPYKWTKFAMPSILNLGKIDSIDCKNNLTLFELTSNNTVCNSFRKMGYELNVFSFLHIQKIPPYYSNTINVEPYFLNGIVQNSILAPLLTWEFKNTIYDINLDILSRIESNNPNNAKPVFAYAHIWAPHDPFVIDEEGQKIPFLKTQRSHQNKESYLMEIRGLNKLVFKSVSKIAERNPDSIIIIMGDHGYRYIGNEEESHSAFLAYRGPNQEKLSELSNSNEIFRLLLK